MTDLATYGVILLVLLFLHHISQINSLRQRLVGVNEQLGRAVEDLERIMRLTNEQRGELEAIKYSLQFQSETAVNALGVQREIRDSINRKRARA